MRLLIIEGVDEMNKRDGDDEIHRRCMECDSSFFLDYISRTVAHCDNCNTAVTPMYTDRYFSKSVVFKVYGDDR